MILFYHEMINHINHLAVTTYKILICSFFFSLIPHRLAISHHESYGQKDMPETPLWDYVHKLIIIPPLRRDVTRRGLLAKRGVGVASEGRRGAASYLGPSPNWAGKQERDKLVNSSQNSYFSINS
jgi:hypothetical protein